MKEMQCISLVGGVKWQYEFYLFGKRSFNASSYTNLYRNFFIYILESNDFVRLCARCWCSILQKHSPNPY